LKYGEGQKQALRDTRIMGIEIFFIFTFTIATDRTGFMYTLCCLASDIQNCTPERASNEPKAKAASI